MKTRTLRRRNRTAQWRRASSYRLPMQIRLYVKCQWHNVYPICPRCENSLDRDYLPHCYHCGQRLGWDRLHEACFIKAGDRERKIHGTRRVHLTVTKDEDAERLSIQVPYAEARRRSRVSRNAQTTAENPPPEPLHPNHGIHGDIGTSSFAERAYIELAKKLRHSMPRQGRSLPEEYSMQT